MKGLVGESSLTDCTSIEDTKLIERHRLQSECLQLQQELLDVPNMVELQ